MASKQQTPAQNLISAQPDQQDSAFLCRETLSDVSTILTSKEEGRVRQCSCRCQCGLQTEIEDPLQRKRQKRKQYKMRQKVRLRQMKEKALVMLREIIRDIYALRVSFLGGRKALEECLRIEDNRERLYEFINEVIREEVDLIRKQLARCLSLYPQQQGKQAQTELIRKVFDLIERIRTASPEIERLIDLFVSCHFDSELVELPLQRNLDRMTLKFLLRNDLQQSEVFAQICTLICEEKEEYARESELFHFMMNVANQAESNSADEDYSDSGYESEDWDEESTGDSQKQSLEGSGGKMRRRRERRRKFKEQYDSSLESVLRRATELIVVDEQRVSCNVSEEWLLMMQERRKQWTKDGRIQ